MVDPIEALLALMAKWIVTALEHGVSNFKLLLQHRLNQLHPFSYGKWQPSLEWYLQPTHASATGSTLWKRIMKAWKHMLLDIQVLSPRIYTKWMAANFWLFPN